MKLMLTAALSLIASTAIASPMTIQGINVDVQVESYRGSEKGPVPHALQLLKPQVFEFKNGLKIELSGRVILHDNGNIWMAQGTATAEPVVFKISGQEIPLNCGARSPVNGIDLPQRILQFYPDLSYRMGCETFKTETFVSPIAQLQIDARSSMDLTPSGDLGYATKILSGQLRVGDQELVLNPGSEVSFHDGQTPAFFTLVKGQMLRATLTSGEVVLVDGGEVNASISLDATGRLEKGILAEDYVVPRLGLNVVKGSGLMYMGNTMDRKSPNYLAMIKFAQPALVKVAGYTLKVRLVELSLWETVTGVVTDENFQFSPPEAPGQKLDIPAGSKITLKSNKVLKIEVPGKKP